MKLSAGLFAILLIGARHSLAEPVIPAGDSLLRHDIQVLADQGVITGPVSSWPLAWGPILSDIRAIDPGMSLAKNLAASVARVRSRAEWETRTHEIQYSAELSAAKSAMRIRSFENTPRESAEVGAGLSWIGDRLTATLKGQIVDQSNGSGETRMDNSFLGVAIGNYQLSVNTLDRWWGPGWDGSIILSNNARPIPAISVDRNFTDAFKSPWLSWLGPWDVSAMMGQLESDRHVPDTLFFGMRLAFRPITSLEIGLSRTAQWCGDGRPCDASTFLDLLSGRDNIGDAGIEEDNEPGNQMAGVDFRWSARAAGLPVAFYGQFIGEDEAGGFPSRYLAQMGIDGSGMWGDRWSYRWFGEVAVTSCNFYESDNNFNCAYNHTIYRTGYRYRGRVIGHGADNDARLISAGLILVDADETQWRLLSRVGELNRGGAIDTRNTVTSSPQDVFSLDLSYVRRFNYGVVDMGLGLEHLSSTGVESRNEARVYLQWRSAY